ncbi:MAG TPA: hypothetical protein PK062_08530, partial [Clostridia bacterium]|nr:hypothetical protein [Clostridia bacterium]
RSRRHLPWEKWNYGKNPCLLPKMENQNNYNTDSPNSVKNINVPAVYSAFFCCNHNSPNSSFLRRAVPKDIFCVFYYIKRRI